MVNKNNNEPEVDLEITNEKQPEFEDIELEDIEESGNSKIKKVREKLSICEEEKKKILDDSQLARADFLNARKRLEDDRARDKVRCQQNHVQDLLPLCDSFQMAMSDTETWEKADKAWRTGIEGIHGQLLRLLEANNVVALSPEGKDFDPHKHEAISTEEVADKKLKDKVITVVQRGYEMTVGGKTEIIRPARVTIGEFKE